MQQNVAQPRQVRKEATVGKEFCVTQGRLTSFCLLQSGEMIASERKAPIVGFSSHPIGMKKNENTKSMVSIHFLIIFFATSLALLWYVPVPIGGRERDACRRSPRFVPGTPIRQAQRVGRYGQLNVRVSPPPERPVRTARPGGRSRAGCGVQPRFMGLSPSSSDVVYCDSIAWTPRRTQCPYEKRNYYQFHGERTPYRHS